MNSNKKFKNYNKGMQPLNSNTLKSIAGGGKIVKVNSFDATTLIKTKTGNKRITDLNIATDEVWNPINQQWMKIARKTNSEVSGIIYEITTNSGCVTVTSNHPFMKMDGTVLHASQLVEGDIIDKGNSGDLVTQVTAIAIEGTQTFHNLVFENATDAVKDHFVEANGVVSGVLFLQDKVTHPIQEAVAVSV